MGADATSSSGCQPSGGASRTWLFSSTSRTEPSRSFHNARAGCSRSRCAARRGTGIDRVIVKRFSSSGQSNDLPLKVTSTGRSARREATSCKIACSSPKSRMKNCSTCNAPASHQASPIRNAYVPVPPAKPVVSVSRKSHFAGAASAARVRLERVSSRPRDRSSRLISEISEYSGDENQLRTRTCCPYLFVAIPAPRSRDSESSACDARSSSAPDGRGRVGLSAEILQNRSVNAAITHKADRELPARPLSSSGPGLPPVPHRIDRKSTRLNSSHLGISYAVFCLKKKKNNNTE